MFPDVIVFSSTYIYGDNNMLAWKVHIRNILYISHRITFNRSLFIGFFFFLLL